MTAAALLLAGMLLGAVDDRGAPARVRSIPLEISARGDCPASEAVAAEIDRILGGARQDAGAARPDRADIDEAAARLRVRLVGADGRIVGDRWIQTAAADCAERAATTAIVLVTWEADLRSPVTLEPPSVADVAPAATTVPPSWSATFGLAGLGVASQAGAPAPGASLDTEIAHPSGWGLRTTLWGTAARSEPLATGVGRARWARWALGIGPRFAGDVGPVRIAAVAELAVARIAVGGDGLSRTYADAMLDWGARGALEVSLAPWAVEGRHRPIALVVGLGAAYWPRRHQVMAAGLAATTRTLPPLDVLMSLGLRWEIGR